MKCNRPAYTLLEMLAVIAALIVLMALSVKPMRTLVLDIPRGNRDLQTWTQTQVMLEQLKADIERSIQIHAVADSSKLSGKYLQLQQPDNMIRYSLTDDRVIRENGSVKNTWELPHVKINWQLWENQTVPFAIEITTWTERTILDKTGKKYEQTFVYFQKKRSL